MCREDDERRGVGDVHMWAQWNIRLHWKQELGRMSSITRAKATCRSAADFEPVLTDLFAVLYFLPICDGVLENFFVFP